MNIFIVMLVIVVILTIVIVIVVLVLVLVIVIVIVISIVIVNWLRTYGANTYGAAAEVVSFGTFGKRKVGQRQYPESPTVKKNKFAATPLRSVSIISIFEFSIRESQIRTN